MTATVLDDRHAIPDRLELEKLEHQADTDPLTGLRNRQSGEEVINRILKNGEKGSLLILELDKLKQIGDIYGHSIDDRILKRVADILKSFTRSEDVLCRYDEDEFLIFYKGFTNTDLLSERCCRLITKTEYIIGEMFDDMHRSEFSLSIGAAIFPEDCLTFAELLENADNALCRVKDRGGHGFNFYHNSSGDTQDGHDGKCFIDMSQLQDMIHESDHPGGTFQVDGDEFKMICRFLARFCRRSGIDAQIVVLKMKKENDKTNDSMVLKAERHLKSVIEGSFRQGDVTSQYGRNQFLIILMNADTKNGKIAVDRLSKNWEALDQDYSIEYEIQNITA